MESSSDSTTNFCLAIKEVVNVDLYGLIVENKLAKDISFV